MSEETPRYKVVALAEQIYRDTVVRPRDPHKFESRDPDENLAFAARAALRAAQAFYNEVERQETV